MTPLPRINTFTIVALAQAAVSSRPKLLPYRSQQGSGHALQRIAEYSDHFVDMRALDDERRRKRDAVAADAQHEAAIETVNHDVIGARADGVRPRGQLYAGDKADGA